MIQLMEQGDRGFAPQPLHPGLEALEDGFCMLDGEWRITYWNAAAAQMFGTDRDQARGRNFWHVLPFLVRSVAWETLHRVRTEGVPLRFTETLPNDARRLISVRAAPLEDGGVTLCFRDITDEIQRGERHNALLESIRDGFIAVDSRWKIVYLNSVAESLLRFPRDRAVGTSLWSLLPEGPSEIAQCLRATMEDGMQRHLRGVRPEGRVFRGRVFDLWAHPLPGDGITIFFEDVSERVQHEKELARLAAEAQEASESKSRFFAAISHELRTPLNAIVGYTHLLTTDTYGELPEPARRAADRAGVCAEHLARLVDDVLLLTTAEIGRLPICAAPIHLQDFLPAIVAPLQLQAQAKGLSFELSVAPDLPAVITDPQRLRQLLLSLLSNAVKFTDRGGLSIHAALRRAMVESREPNGESFPMLADPEVEITVVDTGPGVAPEHRERIFGPFEQLGDPSRSDSMSRGTGLGLTIARQLAHLLRGKLFLAETSPSGSRFCLRLPLTLREGPA